ncbi:MAG TPA: hypothetical protein VGK87_07585, partial [Anaerolineae bacterium]
FHLLFGLVKMLVITPIVLVIVIAIGLFGCALLTVPGADQSLKLPEFVTTIAAQLRHLTTSAPQAAQVTCIVRGKNVIVQWSANSSDDVKTYRVMRRGLQDVAWQRIALVQALKNAGAVYEYGDATASHGATYQYAVVAVGADGIESEMAVSPVQVVAP